MTVTAHVKIQSRGSAHRMCSKHSVTALCCKDFVFLSAFAYFLSCRIIKKSKQRQETVEEMSVTALRRQQLPWRKHGGEPLCQQAGQATGDVYFKEDDSYCPGGLVMRRSKDTRDPLSQRCDITLTSQRDRFKLCFMKSHKHLYSQPD